MDWRDRLYSFSDEARYAEDAQRAEGDFPDWEFEPDEQYPEEEASEIREPRSSKWSRRDRT